MVTPGLMSAVILFGAAPCSSLIQDLQGATQHCSPKLQQHSNCTLCAELHRSSSWHHGNVWRRLWKGLAHVAVWALWHAACRHPMPTIRACHILVLCPAGPHHGVAGHRQDITDTIPRSLSRAAHLLRAGICSVPAGIPGAFGVPVFVLAAVPVLSPRARLTAHTQHTLPQEMQHISVKDCSTAWANRNAAISFSAN